MMKRIYLSALALSIGSLSFGQVLHQKVDFGTKDMAAETKFNNNNPQDKALGAVVWSDDFDTPANWVADNDSQTGAQFGWTIDAVSDGWWSATGITSASGGNFAELSNGDPTGPPAPAMNVTYTLTTIDSIDLIALGGSENSTLEFNQYGARFNDLTEIQISTDGINFVTVGDNLDKLVHSAASSNPWSNPDFKTVNLAPYLNATTAQSVWLRFSWTTNFPASASNPNVWITYGWYLDDLKIRTNPDNDLATTNSYWGSVGIHYYKIPLDQVAPIDFSSNVVNQGLNTQTGSLLTVDVNTGASINTSTPTSIASNATDSLVATYATPTTAGNYAFTWTVSSDSIDDTPLNNTLIGESFDIGGLIYARDTYCASPGTGGGFDANTIPATEEFEAGNMYDIYTTTQVYAIDVVIGAGTQIGGAIDVVLFDLTTGSFVEIDRSLPYIIASGDIGTTKTLALPLQPSVTAGNTYFAAVHAFGGGSEFFYSTCGTSPDNDAASGPTSLIYYPTMVAPATQQNYFTSRTPMIRMNFDPGVGVQELTNNLGFYAYPNPSAGEFNINITSDENVELTVKNIVGQTIINRTVAVAGTTIETISLSDYSKGIYFLTIDNETVKLIVE